MKIDEKTILIVIIVAILGFFLWKSRADKKAAGNLSGDVPPVVIDTSDVNAIIGALGLTPTQEGTVKSNANNVLYNLKNKAEGEYAKKVKANAEANGVSYTKQAVIEGLYVAFAQNGDSEKFQTYKEAVIAM